MSRQESRGDIDRQPWLDNAGFVFFTNVDREASGGANQES